MIVDHKIVREIALTLLGARSPGGTMCPSEIARAFVTTEGVNAVATNWRDVMPEVHKTVDQLLAEGIVQLSWKGKTLAARAGPYRIGRGTPR